MIKKNFYEKHIFLSVTFAAIVYPSCTFANTALSKNKDDSGNITLSIHFNNKEAKEIYKHLEYSKASGEYVLSDNGMGKSHLSSPAITCTKSNPDMLGKKLNDYSPDLYDCDLTIVTHGLTQNP